jgi:hypothetical protein
MMKMRNAYRVELTMEQVVTIFQRPKPKNRPWNEHFISLVRVSHAAGGIPKLVLKSIVKYASPELRPILMVHANMATNDWLL